MTKPGSTLSTWSLLNTICTEISFGRGGAIVYWSWGKKYYHTRSWSGGVQRSTKRTYRIGITWLKDQSIYPVKQRRKGLEWMSFSAMHPRIIATKRLHCIWEDCPGKYQPIVIENLDSKVGIDNTGYEALIVWHKLFERNGMAKNWDIFAFNNISIGGNIFPTNACKTPQGCH